MASTAWRAKPASEKQAAFVQKLADEKQVSALSEEMLDQIADVASGQSITGGEASALIDALMSAPRKAKPSAGFTPLVSGRAARVAEAAAARITVEMLEAVASAMLAAAGGKAGIEGNCNNCGHSDHSGKTCPRSDYHSLGWDDGYNISCTCEEFVAVTVEQDMARTAHFNAQFARDEAHKAENAAAEIERGDRVVVFKGRKIPKGSKGQVAKVSEGTYGWSAFLLLDDGSKAWTALTNLKHEEV